MTREYGKERTEHLGAMFSAEEREQVLQNAAMFGMTQSEFFRHVALGNTVEMPSLRQRSRWAAA